MYIVIHETCQFDPAHQASLDASINTLQRDVKTTQNVNTNHFNTGFSNPFSMLSELTPAIKLISQVVQVDWRPLKVAPYSRVLDNS